MTESPRIMLVEDDKDLSSALASVLQRNGFSVLGPFETVDESIASLDNELPAAAVVDIRLGNQLSFPVGSRLKELHVPFFFTSGYSVDLTEEFSDVFLLRKPFPSSSMTQMISMLLGQTSH